jgi:NTP pyrophosphatase (non-canonical NTP hydrolase)
MDISQLTEMMNEFVTSKGWYSSTSPKPQTPRNLAISLSLEANEVLEHYQWYESSVNKEDLASELADVALYLLQLSSITDIDLEKAILEKLKKNYNRDWNQ